MRIDFTTERLLSGVTVPRFSTRSQRYGRTTCVAAFGYRAVVDFITRPRILR